MLLLLRAFASGAIALSGVEAISNGVPTFREPETRNAATTLMWTGAILGSLFFGIAVLANRLKPTLSETETILSQMGRAVFGSSHNPGYILLQASTVAILSLASAGLLIGFNGNVTKLVPLFAVGLFSAFMLSQTGMVIHHLRRREPS